MKKIIAMTLIVGCLLTLFSCKQEETVVTDWLNGHSYSVDGSFTYFAFENGQAFYMQNDPYYFLAKAKYVIDSSDHATAKVVWLSEWLKSQGYALPITIEIEKIPGGIHWDFK